MDPEVSSYFKPRFHFSADSLLLGMEKKLCLHFLYYLVTDIIPHTLRSSGKPPSSPTNVKTKHKVVS